MQRLVNHVSDAMGSAPAVLVDVSNLREGQLRALAESSHRTRFLFVSTHKTFNYLAATVGEWPALMRVKWLVLRVPGADGRLTRFDGSMFVKTKQTSPVQWRHHAFKKENLCSITRRQGDATRRSSKKHSFCEIDDLLIAQSSLERGSDVLTNDKGLQRLVHSATPVRLHEDMDALMRETRTTVLSYDSGRWRAERP